MTVLVTSDLHLNTLARDQYRHDWQKQLHALLGIYKATTLVINGDLTDDKDFHPAVLVNKVVNHIYELSKRVVVVFNKGNHDYTALAESPFFEFLRRIDNVFWVGEPTQSWKIPGLPDVALADLDHCLFLPHSPNPERDWADLNPDGDDWAQWIFAHQTFEGTKGEHGQVLGGVSVDLLPDNAQVLAGDVHTPQTVGQVTYIGAPYTVDFGDEYEPRVLMLNKRKLTSIECTGPQKRLIEVRAGELPSLQAKQILKQLAPGDLLKVRVELDIGQYARWGEFKDKILAWGAKHKFVIHLVQPVTKQVTTKQRVAKRASNKSDEDVLKSYAKARNIDERTTAIGLELLKCT